MENFYRLTKKELSFISSIQRPILGSDNTRISTPVVVLTNKLNGVVSRVYTLRTYKKKVKLHQINDVVYRYEIRAMY